MADWLCPHTPDICDYAEQCATKLSAELARLKNPHSDPVVEQAKVFIRSVLVGKKASDFPALTENQRHFLFLMRSRLLDHDREGKPFYCSQKQLGYMMDLVAIRPKKPSKDKTFWLARDRHGFMGRKYSISAEKREEQVAHGGKVYFDGDEIDEDDFHKMTGIRLRPGQQVQVRLVLVEKR